MFELNQGRIRQLRHALARLQRPDRRCVSLAFFTPDEVELLRQTALAQEFRRAKDEIRHKGRTVFQDFDVCFPAPRTGAFDQVATQLETGLFRASVDLPNPPLSEALNLVQLTQEMGLGEHASVSTLIKSKIMK